MKSFASQICNLNFLANYRYTRIIMIRSVPKSFSTLLRKSLTPSACRHASLLSSIRWNSSAPSNTSSSSLSSFNILKPSGTGTKTFTSVGNHTATIAGMQIPGPVFVVNNSVFMWDVPQFGIGLSQDVEKRLEQSLKAPSDSAFPIVNDPSSVFHGWSAEYFQILALLEPSPDILVIGTGAQMFLLPPVLKSYIHSLGLQVEVQSSRNAAATFNFLLTEGRNPAAAILPMVPTSARTGEALVKLSSRKESAQS